MPFALVTIGILMIVTGINNTYAQFASQLSTDLFGGNGQKGFIAWAIALALVGALGYINDLRQFSHYFLALILISLVLSNKGVFQKFTAAISAGPTTPQAASSSTSASPSSGGSSTLGLFGQQPSTAGQAKFNGWMNYFFGTGGS